MMPFSGYANFAACVKDQKNKGKSEESARRICGALQARIERKMDDVNFVGSDHIVLGND